MVFSHVLFFILEPDMYAKLHMWCHATSWTAGAYPPLKVFLCRAHSSAVSLILYIDCIGGYEWMLSLIIIYFIKSPWLECEAGEGTCTDMMAVTQLGKTVIGWWVWMGRPSHLRLVSNDDIKSKTWLSLEEVQKEWGAFLWMRQDAVANLAHSFGSCS